MIHLFVHWEFNKEQRRKTSLQIFIPKQKILYIWCEPPLIKLEFDESNYKNIKIPKYSSYSRLNSRKNTKNIVSLFIKSKRDIYTHHKLSLSRNRIMSRNFLLRVRTPAWEFKPSSQKNSSWFECPKGSSKPQAKFLFFLFHGLNSQNRVWTLRLVTVSWCLHSLYAFELKGKNSCFSSILQSTVWPPCSLYFQEFKRLV